MEISYVDPHGRIDCPKCGTTNAMAKLIDRGYCYKCTVMVNITIDEGGHVKAEKVTGQYAERYNNSPEMESLNRVGVGKEMDAKLYRTKCSDIELTYIINAVDILERHTAHTMEVDHLLRLRHSLKAEQETRKIQATERREEDRQKAEIQKFSLWVDTKMIGENLMETLIEACVYKPMDKDLRELWCKTCDELGTLIDESYEYLHGGD